MGSIIDGDGDGHRHCQIGPSSGPRKKPAKWALVHVVHAKINCTPDPKGKAGLTTKCSTVHHPDHRMPPASARRAMRGIVVVGVVTPSSVSVSAGR